MNFPEIWDIGVQLSLKSPAKITGNYERDTLSSWFLDAGITNDLASYGWFFAHVRILGIELEVSLEAY